MVRVALDDFAVSRYTSSRLFPLSGISSNGNNQRKQVGRKHASTRKVVTVAVPPRNTSQNCSNCGDIVKKSLSSRTDVCPHYGTVLDRDHNAVLNILEIGLRTVGYTGTFNTARVLVHSHSRSPLMPGLFHSLKSFKIKGSSN